MDASGPPSTHTSPTAAADSEHTGFPMVPPPLTDATMTHSMASSPDEASSLLFEESPTQSTSPTPKGKGTSGVHTPLPITDVDDMQEDHSPTRPGPTEQCQSAKGNPSRRTLTISRSEGDIPITHAPRPTIGGPTSLHDRLIAAKERKALHQPSKGISRNPLDKYTQGKMPEVHLADPTSMLNFIDINLVLEWEDYDNGKLLAIPFGNEAEKATHHSRIAEKLLTATAEITQSDNIGISTPVPSEEAISNGDTPTSFLIYNLSADEINTLMQRGVWSSRAITFQVVELHPPRPDFLFTIKGFNTRDDTGILNMVKATLQSNSAQNLVDDITEFFTENCQPEIRNNIQDFLNSVYIKRLNYKSKGRVELPRFNVYAKAKFIPDDDVWFYLRETLSKLPYGSPMQGRGITEIAPSTCGICHGVDHPSGLCEFQELEGWNGPTSESLAKTAPQDEGKFSRGPHNYRQTRY